MDRLYLEFPDRIKPDAADEELQILQERGEAHERYGGCATRGQADVERRWQWEAEAEIS